MTDVQARNNFDILIAGGGLAGTALACALGQAASHWRIGLIDPAPPEDLTLAAGSDLASVDLRVSALTKASQSFLDTLGVWPLIAAQHPSAYQAMSVWDAEGTGAIEFQAADLFESDLGHIVENRLTLAALATRLQQLPVERIRGRVLSAQRADDEMVLQLDQERQLRARLLVAADGAESPLRRQMGIPSREWDYQQQALVATVQTSASHQATAWQRFLPSGPLAFLPLRPSDSDQISSIVWSTAPEQAQQLLSLSDEAFCEALGQAFEFRLGPVTAVSRRVAFPLRQRHAKEYVQPGLALVADAAHTIHPLAGQGINLGFLDVAVLADELLRAVERGCDYADYSLLRRYQRRRMGHNLGTMALMEAFKRLFGADPLPLRWLRNQGMRWLNEQSLLKNQIVAAALGRDQLPRRWQLDSLQPEVLIGRVS